MAKFYTPTKLSENIRETPEGFLLCLSVPIARTGWQEYGEGETPLETGNDGIVRVFRDAKEVFRPQTIASFQGKPITIRHPEEFVAPDNWKELAKGIVQNVRRGGEDDDGEESLLADLLVTEKMAIGLVKNGLREVSCGYEAEYEQTGEGEGRQFNIVGNHLALVEEGRAGSTYAINDHKGKVLMDVLKDLAEKIKNLGKTVDEAVTKQGKKTKDMEKVEASPKVNDDAAAYDELVKAVKDLGEKVEGMKKASDEEESKKPAPKEKEKDADAEDEEEKPAKEDESEDEEGGVEDRLKALEVAVAKLLEMEKGEQGDEESEESEMSGDEDEEESEDEDMEKESEDEESEEPKKKTGDAARAEILAPGVKVTKGEDLQVKALKTAYKTEEGKAVIHTLTGGKKPVYDSKAQVSTLFLAASEILKAKRGTGLEHTKSGKGFESFDGESEMMTAEKLNEINAAHWAKK